MPSIQIRPLKALEEFRACERIQLAVWGNLGVGSEIMSVTAKYGGAVVGAVVSGRVVGFLYAFLARRHGRLVHWSHMMAVEPKFRDLAPHLGEQPSSAFLQIQKWYLLLEAIATGLFYVIIVVWMLV